MKKTVHSIQVMRFFAAALVVIYHCQHILLARGHTKDIPSFMGFGQSGVDVFFVISGFIMVYIGWDEFNKPGAVRSFLTRRIIRIMPLYWFYTLAVTVMSLVFPQMLSQGKADPAYIAASFLLIPWENNIGEIMPVLPVGWTLSYEMYFYIVFAALMFLDRRFFLPLAAMWLLGGVVGGMLWEVQHPVLKLMSSPLLVEFLMGCLIGVWYKTGVRVTSRSALIALLLGIGAFSVMVLTSKSGMPRVVSWGVPAAFIIFGLVFLEKNNRLSVPKLLVTLGDSSYSLYLSHLFAVHLTLMIWLKTFGKEHFGLFTVVAFLGSLGVASLSYRLVEKPAINFLSVRYKRQRKDATELVGETVAR